MDPFLVGAVVLLGMASLYLLISRRTKIPSQDGRPDETERPELSGPEQYKRRDIR